MTRRLCALAAVVLVLAGCPRQDPAPRPGQACSPPGATAVAEDGALLVCRRPGGTWAPA